MVRRNFILPEGCKPCLLLSSIVRNLFYLFLVARPAFHYAFTTFDRQVRTRCHDMRDIFRNTKCRNCLIFQAIPAFVKRYQDNQKIGKTFLIKKGRMSSCREWRAQQHHWLRCNHLAPQTETLCRDGVHCTDWCG